MILNLIYCLTNINNPAIVIATIVILIMMSSSLNRSILIAGVSILLVTMLLTSNNNSSSLPTVQGFSPSTRSSTAQVCYINFGRPLVFFSSSCHLTGMGSSFRSSSQLDRWMDELDEIIGNTTRRRTATILSHCYWGGIRRPPRRRRKSSEQ